MYVWFRLARVVTKALFGSRIDPLTAVETPLTIAPGDLDPFGHLNNGRYLTLCDLGRYDLIIRSGIWPILKKRGLKPVVASIHVRFRRSLQPFDRVTLRTELVFWDQKWFYFEHTFIKEASVYARLVLKGAIRSAGGTVSMAELVEALGEGHRPVPEPPGWVLAMREFEERMR